MNQVSLVEIDTIQPDQKVDLICRVNGANLEGIQGVLEPMDKFFERSPIAVPSTPPLVNEGSVPVRFYNYSGRPVTIYKDTNVGEFCPAVEGGQAIPTARNYRVESATDDSGEGTVNCNALSVESEPSWDIVDEMGQLFPIDNDQITYGSYRYCVDFRKLNSVTVKEHYPIPRVEDMIDTLAGAKFFSTLDFVSAYHAFEIHNDDREKTAFSTKQGHWQWKRVPFGLCNAAPFFVRQIASLLAGMAWEEL